MKSAAKKILFPSILLLTSLLFLAGCDTTGGAPWGTAQTSAPTSADAAPDSLITETAQTGAIPPGHGPAYQSTPGGAGAYPPGYGQHPVYQAPYTDPSQPHAAAPHAQVGYSGTAHQQTPYHTYPAAVPPGATAAAATGHAVKIAFLAPLSGPQAELGQAMLQAAQLALFDMNTTTLELMPHDTKGTANGASAAAQDALNAGASLILGPVFSPEVRAARNVTNRHNINMISFTTDWNHGGYNSFIMGFMPFGQVERILSYAGSRGIKRIGLIAPADEYGNAVTSALNAALPQTGITLVDTLRFSGQQRDFSTAIRRFSRYDVRAGALDPQIRALEDRLRAQPDDATARTQLESLRAQTATNAPFDAVLIAAGGEQARLISQQLSHFGLGPTVVRRLGTGLWDDQTLAADPALQGGWFAAPAPAQRSGFETRYADTFGQRPPRLSTLAYDATALAAVLSRQGRGADAYSREALANPNGFAGIDGVFRFRPDGLVERGLAVLEFNNGYIQQADPAPTTFQNWRTR